jgi:hypothetical protein
MQKTIENMQKRIEKERYYQKRAEKIKWERVMGGIRVGKRGINHSGSILECASRYPADEAYEKLGTLEFEEEVINYERSQLGLGKSFPSHKQRINIRKRINSFKKMGPQEFKEVLERYKAKREEALAIKKEFRVRISE